MYMLIYRYTWKAKNECVNWTVAFILSTRQFLASVSSRTSRKLSNRDDIFAQTGVNTSSNNQMAEYVTETEGIPGKKKHNIFHTNTCLNI